MKKAQITLFIIIGLLVVGVFAFFFVAENNSIKIGSNNGRANLGPVENYIQTCVDRNAKEALLSCGIDGGIWQSKSSVGFFGGYTPYYFGTSDSRIPQISELEGYLAKYVDENLKNCLNYSSLANYQVSSGEIKTSAKINDNAVQFSINYPIEITSEGSVRKANSFETTINSRIKLMLNASMEYIEIQKEYPEYMCMSCMIRIGAKNNLFFYTYTVGDSVAYQVFDNRTPQIKNEEAKYFMFAVKYPQTAQ